MKKLILKGREKASIAILGATLSLLPSQAFADSATGIAGFTSVADTILQFLTGPIATAVGAIAIALVGYRWFSGRMEMGRAAATVGGIVLIIGSAQIVSFIRTGAGLTGAVAPASSSSLEIHETQFATFNDVAITRRLG